LDNGPCGPPGDRRPTRLSAGGETRPPARPVGRPGSFFADGWTSGPQNDSGRCGFRRKPPPSKSSLRRTNFLRGAAFPRLDRCRFGCGGEPLSRPGQPQADPASPRCPRREVPPVNENQFPSLRPLHTQPRPHTASPWPPSGPVVRALCPCRGARAHRHYPSSFLPPSIGIRRCRPRADVGTAAAGFGVFGHLKRRTWADVRSAMVKSAGFPRCVCKGLQWTPKHNQRK
jgi:hypothetical protein